jgi:hypothetical protein
MLRWYQCFDADAFLSGDCSPFGRIARYTRHLTIFYRCAATFGPRIAMVCFPATPITNDPLALQLHLARALVATKNCHALVVSEKTLIILQLQIRNLFKEAPQKKIVPPLDAVFRVGAMTGLFLILDQFGLAQID